MKAGLFVVTGGNRGLGLEVCRQLARTSRRVLLTARRRDRAEAAAAVLAGEGLAVESAALDVADPASVSAFVAALTKEGAHVDALVNNAGVSLSGFDADAAAQTLATNTFGAAALTDALVDRLIPGGRVVMVSSGQGSLDGFGPELRTRFLDPKLDRTGLGRLLREFVEAVGRGDHRKRGWPGNAYSVSKAGLNAFVRLMAPEMEARDQYINAVCPGWVRTDMGGQAAPRPVDEGASGIVWAATLPPDGPSGGFYRDRIRLSW